MNMMKLFMVQQSKESNLQHFRNNFTHVNCWPDERKGYQQSIIPMAQHKTTVTSLQTHWSYCSVALSHQFVRVTRLHREATLLCSPSLVAIGLSVRYETWPPMDEFHRYGAPTACREPVESYNRLLDGLYVFEHKTQYLLIRVPYTCIVLFWHISNMPP